MGLESPVPNKSRFPRAREVVYLDSAAEGLPPEDSAEALARYFRDKSSGSTGRAHLYEAERETVAAAARMLQTDHRNVALLSNATEGLNLLANSIDWRPGDEVLISDLEFPSNVVVWLRLQERGVRVQLIPSDSGELHYEQFASRIHSSTRLVSISQVSYKTGTQVPFLSELGREVHRSGGIFCVDATQAMGRVPVSVENVDLLVASTYKWLLGVHGLGVTYLSPKLEESLQPGAVGWYGINGLFAADRFERFAYKAGAARLVCGMPNFPSIYALRNSLNYLLGVDVARIDTTLKPLVRKLRDGLAKMGLAVLTPAGQEFASGIVSFAHPDAEAIGAGLATEGVIVWAGDGRVRAAVHLYNDESDINGILSALDRVLQRLTIAHA